MGTSRTIVLGQQPTAAEVQAVIGGPFDVTWFGDANRWNVTVGTSYVFLDYDPDFGRYFDQYLSDQEQAAVLNLLGGRPGLALHAQISTVTPGSSELANEVIRCILGRWPGAVDPV